MLNNRLDLMLRRSIIASSLFEEIGVSKSEQRDTLERVYALAIR